MVSIAANSANGIGRSFVSILGSSGLCREHRETSTPGTRVSLTRVPIGHTGGGLHMTTLHKSGCLSRYRNVHSGITRHSRSWRDGFGRGEGLLSEAEAGITE